ncbi:MAG: MFS transporter [Chloroflexota bacterium]|nr:MFS transporter [Chloroflexota bacterium]
MNFKKTFPILVAYLVFIVIGIASGLLNISWTYMQDTFNVSHDSLAALAPAAMLGGLFAAFLSGSIISRFSIGPVLVGGMAFAGIGILGYAIAPAWIVLLGVAFIASIGKGTMDAGLNNFASANYGASVMNWLHACWGIGLTIAPAVVTHFVIYEGSGWQSSYVLVGIILLLIGLVILLSLPLWKIQPSSDTAKGGLERPSARYTLRRPIVILGLVFFFLYGGVEIGTGQLANTLLIEARSLPQEIASSWVSAYWASFTVGRITMGLLAMRLGDRTLLNICFGFTVIGALLLFLNMNDVLSLLGLVGIGFGLAAVFPILILQTNERVGRDHAVNAIGFQVGCAGLGGAALAGMGGVFAEYVGPESISFFIFLGALLMVALYEFMIRWEARKIIAAKASH